MALFRRLEPDRVAGLMAAPACRASGPAGCAWSSSRRWSSRCSRPCFARLYYLQVVDGEEYHAQAASQSVREIVVQPQRGLIVDDQGRPLVANRSSWVVSVDRTVLGKMTERQQDVLRRPGRRRRRRPGDDDPQARWSPAATTAASPGSCWNGSPYQPVPVATDVPQRGRAADPRAARGLPGAWSPSSRACAPTRARTASTSRTCSATSARSPRTSSTRREEDDDTLGQRRLVGRPRRRREAVRPLAARHARLPAASRSTRWAGCSATTATVAGQPGDTLVTSHRRPGPGASSRSSSRRRSRPRAATHDPVTGRNYVADSGAAVVMEAKTGRIVAMASQPTYDPEVWVGGITKKQLARLYSEAAGTPLLGRATQGQFAPGSTWKPFMTAGALTHGYTHRHPAQLLLGLPGRQPGVQELRVRRLRLHRLRQGARGLVQHLLLPGRLRLLAAATAPTSPT